MIPSTRFCDPSSGPRRSRRGMMLCVTIAGETSRITPRRRGDREHDGAPRVAEFFAGIGLVRRALENEGARVVFANDIDASKRDLYRANFDTSDFVLSDVTSLRGADVPRVEIATASFPCTDLSLAGNRAGLSGEASGMFWQFARVIDEMGTRRPDVVLIENVVGLATSRGGSDLEAVVHRLNAIGYSVDILFVDARWFVPQSRPRLFIVGASERVRPIRTENDPTDVRPEWIARFIEKRRALAFHSFNLPRVETSRRTITALLSRLTRDDGRWWSDDRLESFMSSLSPVNAEKIAKLRAYGRRICATAYRRTRNGVAVWEIRADGVSGCLRTSRGGSSKQAVVEVDRDDVRVRWMTASEYAALQGVPDYNIDGFSENAAIMGFGDAVCVPAVSWLARYYILPVLGKARDGTPKPSQFSLKL